ncbi:MAG: type II toxin-antitoxin system VapC family toxin [Acidimicrobiales bacterium]
MNVFDASALLAFAGGEPGADAVEQALETEPGVCGAANWSEVAQKVRTHDRDWSLVRALLLSYDLRVEPVTQADGELAASMWERGAGLSLADRLCLALGRRLDATVWTADTTWGSGDPIRQIR